jgi:hypothetical protein
MPRNEHSLGGFGELPAHAYPEPEKFPPDRPTNLKKKPSNVPTVRRASFAVFPQVATTNSQSVLAGNPKRCYLLIQNNGTDYIRVNYGNNASLFTTRIPPNGGSYDYPVVPINAIYILAESGTQQVVIEEGTEIETVYD